MRWFERPGAEPVEPAKFNEVKREGVRTPAWIVNRAPKHEKQEKQENALLESPRLPSEFVDAIRHELTSEPPLRGRTRNSLGPVTGPKRSAGSAPTALDTEALLAASIAATLPLPTSAPPPVKPSIDPELVNAFVAAIGLLESERAKMIEKTAGQLAELAATIARRVIAKELSLDPTLVVGLVREGLEALGDRERVVVRIGRAFADASEQLEQRLRDGGERFEIRIDPTLGDYGCVVETELGQVDESVEQRLETLLQALRPSSQPPG